MSDFQCVFFQGELGNAATVSSTCELQGRNSRWTETQDEELIELWRKQKCLFDPTIESYHNKKRKYDKWKKIAGQLGRNVDEVRKRATSLRTMYGKLLHSDSPGDCEAKPYTGRQRWLMRKLDFLQGFLRRRCHAQTTTPRLQSTVLSSEHARLRRARDRLSENPLGSCRLHLEPLNSTGQNPLSTLKPSHIKTESEEWRDLSEQRSDQQPFGRKREEKAVENEPYECIGNAGSAPRTALICAS
ncbi:uncharacterized protein LOC118787181 [Megalops cyprinoides]|uniref:uncharacterized protein LOC118787181 n=1 Tax=Megalops cyprinoides TaxID=118141 RepID=UPI00186488E4|nr:uncharacterized protein LOC118787181 [Megalops cyprinoides]